MHNYRPLNFNPSHQQNLLLTQSLNIESPWTSRPVFQNSIRTQPSSPRSSKTKIRLVSPTRRVSPFRQLPKENRSPIAINCH